MNIKKFIKTYLNNPRKKMDWWVKKYYKKEYELILSKTKFLNPKTTKLIERIYCINNNITSPVLCEYCKKEKTDWRGTNKGYLKTCSWTCSSRIRNTKKEQEISICRKNNLDYKAVMRKTKFLPEFSKISERIYCYKNKIKKVPVCEECGKNTKFYSKKYTRFCSSKCSCKNKAVCEKKKISNYSKFSIKTQRRLKNPKLLERLHVRYKIPLTKISSKLGVSANVVVSYYRKYGLEVHTHSISFAEKEIRKLITKYNFETNKRDIIPPYELDIYIPEKKLAIEFNGNYWHSSIRKERLYHQEKSLLCKEKGIRLIHIFEYQWNDPRKRKILESIISECLGKSKKIYARKTIVKTISKQDANKFCEENHLQGKCNMSKLHYGLFYKDELVSVMSFGHSRFDKRYNYELLRFCNKLNISITGGASKLFSKFLKENPKNSVISYANFSLFFGGLYKNLGFEYKHMSSPGYVYEKCNKVISRYSAQKGKLKKLLGKNNFVQELSETENMINNGFNKIYDSGNLVYEYIK